MKRLASINKHYQSQNKQVGKHSVSEAEIQGRCLYFWLDCLNMERLHIETLSNIKRAYPDVHPIDALIDSMKIKNLFSTNLSTELAMLGQYFPIIISGSLFYFFLIKSPELSA